MTEPLSRRNMLGLALAAPVAVPMAIAGFRKHVLARGGIIHAVPGVFGEIPTEAFLPLREAKALIVELDAKPILRALVQIENRIYRITHLSRAADGFEIEMIEDQMREHDLFEEVEA